MGSEYSVRREIKESTRRGREEVILRMEECRQGLSQCEVKVVESCVWRPEQDGGMMIWRCRTTLPAFKELVFW